MNNCVQSQVAGWEIHGFHTREDLDKIIEDAKTRWLRPNEIYAILYNFINFPILAKPLNLPKVAHHGNHNSGQEEWCTSEGLLGKGALDIIDVQVVDIFFLEGGTVVLFDREKIRNFRKDGHNWKKKKDGKTVQEAHERLKIGSEHKIHVYYAHGEDNPGFMRRCYWLLDKKYERVVLVHYRETAEMSRSPMTPLDSNSDLTYSDASPSRALSEDTKSSINHPTYGDSDMDPIDWIDFLEFNDSEELVGPEQDEGSHFIEHNQDRVNDPGELLMPYQLNENGVSLSSLGDEINLMNGSPSFVHRLHTNMNSQMIGNQMNPNVEMDPNVEGEKFEAYVTAMNESFETTAQRTPQTQNNFGRSENYTMSNSSYSFDGLPVNQQILIDHEPSTPTIGGRYLLSGQQEIFSITDVSPSWGFSTEETKVIMIGNFHASYSHLAQQDLYCFFGDKWVIAKIVQSGVYRCTALPCSPGYVDLYLSCDGSNRISQVWSFQYHSPPQEKVISSFGDISQREFFIIRLRLARLLFCSTNNLNILPRNLEQEQLEKAKEFANITSSIEKDWKNMYKSTFTSDIAFQQAEKNSLLELILKNKLQEWLLDRVVEGCGTTERDHQGQGVIHLCAILDYAWVVRPYSHSAGLSLDFRDSHGWTALHWAACYGRQKMAAELLYEGADPCLVTDPTSECPGGLTASDVASKNGFSGLAAYLAQQGLTTHLRHMFLSGHAYASQQPHTSSQVVNPGNLDEEQICMEESLAALRLATDAAACIQAAFRENSLKLQTVLVESTKPMIEARNIIAAMKIQQAFRNHDRRKRMRAVARIQHTFRTWKIRKEFINLRQQTIKIQAAFRGHEVRKQHQKILWSVGVLEKAILRWRLRRKGLRGLHIEQNVVGTVDQKEESDAEEDFFKDSRKQVNERIERSVVKVQALFRCYQARKEYRMMKLAYDQTKFEREKDQ